MDWEKPVNDPLVPRERYPDKDIIFDSERPVRDSNDRMRCWVTVTYNPKTGKYVGEIANLNKETTYHKVPLHSLKVCDVMEAVEEYLDAQGIDIFIE